MSEFKYGAAMVPAAVAALQVMIPITPSFGQSVEEIVVTTRRKEENLQEVPIAVTAIGADAIERQGLTNMFKLADIDPSVAFDTSYGPGDTRVAIRGLSNTRGRSNVAFLVDGVDVTSENQIAAGSGLLANQRLLTDVERIEIVKGPQSALYGRAAFAGAIAYTTKNPTDTFTGNLGVDAAEDNEYQLKGAISGPITDTLGFRLDAVGWSADGRYDNSVSGSDVGGGDGWGTSGTLRWEPTDTFDIKARIAYSDDENDPRPVVLMRGDTFAAYPDSAIEAGIGVGGPFFGTGQELGLVNHGTYCPDVGVWNDGNPLDPDFSNTLSGVEPGTPGICLPGNFGSVSDLPKGKNSITHSETLYGDEQPGYTLDLFRSSLNANWETPAGLVSFIGGYTNADQTDVHDQDFQAFERPDLLGANDPFLDYGDSINIGHQQSDTETETRLISGELRFSTNSEGPVNATVGYMYWDLKVDTEDRNYIANCMKAVVDFEPGTENVFTGLPTVSDNTVTNNCDGGTATTIGNGPPVTGETVDNWQEYIRQFRVTDDTVAADSRTALDKGRIPGAPWVSDTDHQSIYTQVAWDMQDSLKLTAEARWVDEKFSISRPNQASCGNISTGYGRPDGTTALGVWYREGTGNVPDQNCSSVTGQGTFDAWQVIEGSEEDDFIVPKATLEWFADEDQMYYFSWAKARKPGGINQLAAGGSSVTIDQLRFDPEKMTTWEVGSKTSWDLGGLLIANGALFYNDYTDKQVATQVLDENGALQPRVENASSAEVQGVEVDLTWYPEFIPGLNLRAAYTYQDAEYNDYTELTQSVPRAAANGSCNVVDATGDGDFFCALDLSGKALERQAENAFSGNFGYVRPLAGSDMEWFLEGDAVYTDKRYLDQDNFIYFDSYWLFNFRLGTQTDKWDVTVFLDNAFDDDTIRTGGSGPDFGLQNTRLGFIGGLGVNGYFGILPDPRTLGVRTNFRFGS